MIKYTTPSLNAKPIPPNTEQGAIELAHRVQLKLNEMMMITEYILDRRWRSILTMASSNLYNAQKTTWMLMKNLENEKIRESVHKRQERMRRPQQAQNQYQQNVHNRQSMQYQNNNNYDSHNQTMNTPQHPPPQNNQNNNNNMHNNINSSLHEIRDISSHDLINDLDSSITAPRMAMNTDIIEQNKQNDQNNINKQNMNDNMNMNQSQMSTKSKSGSVDSSSSINSTSHLAQKYSASFSGQEPEIDEYGLPILPDKSKYKAVAMEYCQKMGWKRPVEATQCVGVGYRATVTFGKPGKEKSASGDGLRQKNAIYEAYIKLLPIVIPKGSAIELIIKWVPGYKKQEKVSTATVAQSGQSIMKHPKSVLLEWAQKNSIAPPKTQFSEFADSARNMRIWTAKVTFCGKTIESKGSKKKDAESKCFQELLKHVMNGGITKHKQ